MPALGNANPLLSTYQVQVVIRFFIAIVGGYFFTALCASLLALLLPTTHLDALLFALSSSLIFYTLVFIGVFSCRSFRRLCVVSTMTLTLLYALLISLGGTL